jgi:hypothetical protein
MFRPIPVILIVLYVWSIWTNYKGILKHLIIFKFWQKWWRSGNGGLEKKHKFTSWLALPPAHFTDNLIAHPHPPPLSAITHLPATVFPRTLLPNGPKYNKRNFISYYKKGNEISIPIYSTRTTSDKETLTHSVAAYMFGKARKFVCDVTVLLCWSCLEINGDSAQERAASVWEDAQNYRFREQLNPGILLQRLQTKPVLRNTSVTHFHD